MSRTRKGSFITVRPDAITTTERNNLNPEKGEVIHNLSTGDNEYWNGSQWIGEGAVEPTDLDGRIIVTQANVATTLGGVIDSTKEYFLDGVIDLGTIQITVPVNGMTIRGYSFDISGLISSENNYTMFISESIPIGSGNLLGQEFFITVSGTGSKVYELYDATGFNAFEFTRINYIDCTSLGDIYDYRQGLETGTGRFGGSPSLTLHGLWRGGYRITTSIVRSLSAGMTEPLFKEGLLFQMNSRFLSDINCDLPASAALLDFQPLNFPNPSTLQLRGCIISRDGVFDPTDANIVPNISESDLSSEFANNQGLFNTFVGGELALAAEVETTINTQNVSEVLAGTFTAKDLQHFSSPANAQLKFNGTNPVEYTVSWDFVLEGVQNIEYSIELIRFRDAVETIIHQQTRVINNSQGGRDVAYFTGNHHDRILNGDITYFKVRNLDGTGNCTLELDSTWEIDAR